ncbi:hypothetical protein BAUCODRAFT_62024 [Baudoinia panamericana UAMH 10762]|uniref:Polyketide synthase n=1 Tax=Baudoinia panamericana (strain UAMH 10762) TaxID=717646 RepID=M2N8F6_BAUPA|nr:uncharacterized protein BAUCODRAFT_62024 [Baudoinia panamericana UAMH 10762]EMD00429.1 hypothetical protein BAUCODRAFT_62024 [Baudoinia panamericana UAMH 10762]
MSPSAHVFLFGDQTYDFVPDLRKLLAIKTKPVLNAFFEQAHYVIRAQAQQWLGPVKAEKARSASLADLLQKYTEGHLSPAFQVALHSLTQLGAVIRHVLFYDEPGRLYPTQGSTYLVGLCTGALAAAAIASSGSLSELLPAAVHTVQLALRLGLHAIDVRDRIYSSVSSEQEPWSVLYFGVDEPAAAAALEKFSREKALTISGPPSTLKLLRKDVFFGNCKSKPIPIYLPAHVSHLYSMEDVRIIMSSTNLSQFQDFNVKLPVISGATGVFAWGGGLTALLEKALCECLLEPIRWDKVVANFSSLVSSSGTSTIVISPIATNLEQNMSAALKEIANVSVERLEALHEHPLQQLPQSRAKLAIVGMSGRFPEAPSPADFWDLLYQGLDVCKEVPVQRWNWKTHVTADGKGHNLAGCKWGCWLDYADQFDPRFFSISPKEAPQIDPAQRMALMTTYEALEQSGFVADKTASSQRTRVGVFHGITSNDYLECNSGQFIDTYFITGGNRAFVPGRINFCFEFCGPSYSNDTACSSSLAAIHLACNSLWRGDCDTAVAGGTNMCINPDGHTGLDKGFFLSRTGNCKPFDDKADGYCRGEAVATVIIKRLDDAIAENDPILGVILDTKTNHSSLSDSMTRPHVGAQADNMKSVLASATVNASDVSYVEMHGTGTQVGDAVEMESVLKVFAPDEQQRTPENPLYVGTVKANIGHGEGVSGITSLTKVLLMLKNNMIPPHCGIKPGSKINRTYPDLGARNVHIAFKPTPWERRGGPRRALINNFSAAGGNTALLLEEAPPREVASEDDPRTSHVLTVSGHVAASLKNNAKLLLQYLQQHTGTLELAQLSYTLTARRQHHIHRISITGATVQEISDRLSAAIERGDGSNRPKSKPKMLFAFTGQGAMWVAVGKQLHDAFPSFRSSLYAYDRMAQALGLSSFLPLLVDCNADVESSPAVTVQLATTALQMALADLLRSFGMSPVAVTGHSLGMYAALYTSGVLTASDAIYLVGKRAELFQQSCARGTHAMLAIKASESTVNSQLTGQQFEIACANGPQDTVISGKSDCIAKAQAALTSNGIKSTMLKVPYAFHSAQVDPILKPFSIIASGVTFRKPTITVLDPLTGAVVDKEGVFSATYLQRHCRETVDMVSALQAGLKSGIVDVKSCISIEIGPHPVVCGMIRNTLGADLRSMAVLERSRDVWPNLTNLLGSLYGSGAELDWTVYHQAFKSAHKVLELPAYAWDLKSYWIAYENDWCIHKPFALQNVSNTDNKKAAALPPPAHEPVKVEAPSKETALKLPPAPPAPLTSTVHSLSEETIEADSIRIVVEGDLGREDLRELARGHVVNDVPFTTPSWFADIAYTVGTYTVARLCPNRDVIVNVGDLAGDKVLVPTGRAGQNLRLTFTASFERGQPQTITQGKFVFNAVDAKGRSTTRYGFGVIRFADRTLYRQVTTKLPDYLNSIKRLRFGAEQGELCQYNKRSGYRLMSKIAGFGADYKLLDDVVVDESSIEATCFVNFATIATKGNFAAHPGGVDAFTQLAGFCVNARECVDLDNECFISHGWNGLELYAPLTYDCKYELYVRMSADGTDWFKGDTAVLHDGKLVAFFKEVIVHRMPRKFRSAVTDAFATGSKGKAPVANAAKPAANKPAVRPETHYPGHLPTESGAPKHAAGKIAPSSVSETSQPVAVAAAANAQAAETVARQGTAPKTPSQPKIPKASGLSAKTSKSIDDVLNIVSEESGVAKEELTDDSNFADMGVDSLCSMVIGSRLREELLLELGAEFSIFVDCPTVRSLKAFLIELNGEQMDEAEAANAEEPGLVEPAVPEHVEENSVRFTEPPVAESVPLAKTAAHTQDSIIHHATPDAPASNITVTANVGPARALESKNALQVSTSAPVVNEALDIVAQESGIAKEDLSDDSVFADIGVDSLCSMVIQSRLREELAIDLDPDFSIFVNCPTVADLKAFLSEGAPGVSGDSSDSAEDSGASTVITPPEEGPTPDWSASDECRSTTSVILQGIPKLANKTLFLMPDGSGSATSYITIPKLGDDIAVVGLNCPYIRDPEELKCTPTAMVRSFCNEIKRRQPTGPYHVGGWSAGGGFAFACAYMLTSEGHAVDSLIIIDSPIPSKLGTLPAEFYEYCGKLGLFGTGHPPTYLIPHFLRVMEAMLPYQARPVRAPKMPTVGLVWATETVMDGPNPPVVAKSHFMLQKRQNFGPDGWETLLPGADFIIEKVEGANHFTMMVSQAAQVF